MANAVVTVLEADGVTETDVTVLDVGRQIAAASKSVAAATEDKAVLDAIAASLALLDNSISAGNELQVDVVGAIPAGTNNIGDVDVLTLNGVAPAFGSGAAGATVLRTLSATDDPVVSAIVGTVADGADDAGNSSKIGGVVHTAMSGDTMLADAKRAHWAMSPDQFGYVRSVALDDIVSGNANTTADTSTTCIAASGDAAIKTYLTKVIVTNMHASTVAYVEIKSGTTVKATIPCPPGGAVVGFDPPLPPNAANEVWAFDPSAAVTTIYCSMVGFKSKA